VRNRAILSSGGHFVGSLLVGRGGGAIGGHLLVRNIGLNDTRTALLGVLVRMGRKCEAVEDVDQMERARREVTGVPLKGIRDSWQRNRN